MLPPIRANPAAVSTPGNIGLYRKILRQFADRQAGAPQRIRNALQEHDFSTAEREAHTLKGVAGNIGAHEVQAAAERLELAVKQGGDTKVPMVELERKLTAASDTVAAGAFSGSIADLLQGLDRLQTLLEDYDGEAGDLIVELESRVAGTEFAQSVRMIAERIDDFEFDEALVRLNGLREAMNSTTADPASLA